MMEDYLHRFARLNPRAKHIYAVPFPHFIVIPRIGECQGQHALFLEIRLVDAGKTLGYHSLNPEKTGFHRGVFPTAALAVILLSNHHGPATLVPVLAGRSRNCNLLPLTKHRIGLSVEGIHRAHQQVF